jgi:hypothetical protein
MTETEREVARGVLDLAAFWLFLQYVLPVLAVLAIAFLIYRAVRKPRHAEFVSSEPDEFTRRDRDVRDVHDDWPTR